MLQVVGIWVCVQYLGVWIDIWVCVLYLWVWIDNWVCVQYLGVWIDIWVCVQYLGVWIDNWACVLYLGAWLIFGCTKIVAPRYDAKNCIGVAIFAIHHKGLVWFALANWPSKVLMDWAWFMIKSRPFPILVISAQDLFQFSWFVIKTYSSSRDLWSRPIPVFPRYLVVFLKLQILRQIANLVLIVLHIINFIVWDREIWQNIGPLVSVVSYVSVSPGNGRRNSLRHQEQFLELWAQCFAAPAVR